MFQLLPSTERGTSVIDDDFKEFSLDSDSDSENDENENALVRKNFFGYKTKIAFAADMDLDVHSDISNMKVVFSISEFLSVLPNWLIVPGRKFFPNTTSLVSLNPEDLNIDEEARNKVKKAVLETLARFPSETFVDKESTYDGNGIKGLSNNRVLLKYTKGVLSEDGIDCVLTIGVFILLGIIKESEALIRIRDLTLCNVEVIIRVKSKTFCWISVEKPLFDF